jgi:hypothetical protein
VQDSFRSSGAYVATVPATQPLCTGAEFPSAQAGRGQGEGFASGRP